MGSNQSSTTADNGQATTISIDPNGNITKKSNKTTNSDKPQQEQQYKADKNNDNNFQEPASSFDSTTQQSYGVPKITKPPPALATIDTTASRGNNDINLKQADEITTRLKNQYKPNSAQMAGKERSVFDEVERNVIQCYKTNKNQPSNCTKVVQEYQNYVKQQRNSILNKTANSSIPIISVILLTITCLLLHVTTIHCFGAMSIDLGSEWMKVGLVAPSVQMDIVLNAQSQRKTAMAIAFANGERFVGDTAMDVASKYPEKTFTHFLDLVGKTVEHESVKQYKRRFPYADIKSHEPNSTSIILNHPDGLQFTPLELIAMMLQHAHDQVTNRLNSNEPASDVVITVPPFFNMKERKVIQDAAKLVGLNVLRLTNVNSAFALSYGIFRHKDYAPEQLSIEDESNSNINSNRTSILFFDQGASHTSVTLADYHLVEQIDDSTNALKNETLPTITIRAQVFDRYLGGFDMQLKLRDYLVKEFSKTTGIDESKIFKRGRSAAKLLKESGRVKKVLSANTDHTVRVENVIDDKDLKQPISRQQFEELNKEYLDERIRNLLDKLFEMPQVNKDDPIESVIIVGGNTRTPKIQQVLLDYFKLDVLGKSINADEGAALAALYQAASLGRGFRVKKFVLEEYGEERRRYDPTMTTTTTTTTAAPEPTSSESSSEDPSAGASSTTESPSERVSVVKVIDPYSIYSDSELVRIKNKLAYYREQDFMRLQRLSLRNSLESLLSEAREKLNDIDEKNVDDNTSNNEMFKEKKEDIQKVIKDTYVWLEDGPMHETDNVTILADKYTAIYDMIHPRPPPTTTTLPPPIFDPSKVDLSSVFNNETLNILNMMNTDSNSSANTDPTETKPGPLHSEL